LASGISTRWIAAQDGRSKRKRREMRVTLWGIFAAGVVMTISGIAHAAVCDARAMGAKGDGKTKDTAALQAAIDACAAKGGGDVRLAPGTYLSAPLSLKSHVHLVLQKDAVLLGSPDVVDYPLREDARWRRVSLLHADKVTDIAITGEGTVDGQGQGWWARQMARAKGAPEDPRPMLVDITNSSKILIEGVTIQNSPQYNIITFVCDGLTVRNVRILNPGKGAPNTDGIDPLSTSHVLIEHAYIDTGDDNIAIKSGLVGRDDPLVPSSDIVIRDCTFVNGHGLSIGSEIAGGVKNVTVERVSFKGTRQGIRIKSGRGRGNDIGNFVYRDITMDGVETPIQITMCYTGCGPGVAEQPMTEHTPRFHDIRIENLTATNAKNAIQVDGLPESPVKGLVLKNVKITAERGMSARYADIVEDNVEITAKDSGTLEPGPGVTVHRN
jgi:polygalacturonase